MTFHVDCFGHPRMTSEIFRSLLYSLYTYRGLFSVSFSIANLFQMELNCCMSCQFTIVGICLWKMLCVKIRFVYKETNKEFRYYIVYADNFWKYVLMILNFKKKKIIYFTEVLSGKMSLMVIIIYPGHIRNYNMVRCVWCYCHFHLTILGISTEGGGRCLPWGRRGSF